MWRAKEEFAACLSLLRHRRCTPCSQRTACVAIDGSEARSAELATGSHSACSRTALLAPAEQILGASAECCILMINSYMTLPLASEGIKEFKVSIQRSAGCWALTILCPVCDSGQFCLDEIPGVKPPDLVVSGGGCVSGRGQASGLYLMSSNVYFELSSPTILIHPIPA